MITKPKRGRSPKLISCGQVVATKTTKSKQIPTRSKIKIQNTTDIAKIETPNVTPK